MCLKSFLWNRGENFLDGLIANESGVETAGYRYIGRPLYQGAPVGKERHRVLPTLKSQQEPVEVDLTMRFQPSLHLGKVDRRWCS